MILFNNQNFDKENIGIKRKSKIQVLIQSLYIFSSELKLFFDKPSITQSKNLSSIFLFPIGVFFRIDRALSNLLNEFQQNQLVEKVHVFILEYVLDKTGILVKIMHVPLNLLVAQGKYLLS